MLQRCFFIFISVVVSASQASAFSVLSQYSTNSKGAYYKAITMLCGPGEESACQAICQQDVTCRRVEPYCLNCAGTSSLLLRTLFTQIATNFTATNVEIPTVDFINYLATQKYILIGANSLFNYYRPLNSDELMNSLKALCPLGDEDPLLSVKLNRENTPIQLDFVICRNAEGVSKAYQVQKARAVIGPQNLNMNLSLK